MCGSPNVGGFLVSRTMSSQNVHVLILGICDYVTVHGKGTLHMWLRALRWESVPDYPGGLSVITRGLKVGERERSQSDTG